MKARPSVSHPGGFAFFQHQYSDRPRRREAAVGHAIKFALRKQDSQLGYRRRLKLIRLQFDPPRYGDGEVRPLVVWQLTCAVEQLS
jgi:hypothetical protein